MFTDKLHALFADFYPVFFMNDDAKEQHYFDLNQRAWDQRVAVHVKSSFYDVAGFLNGDSSLREIELQELGSVAGLRLLHLQCHFGMDTLSLARLGAHCTGVDLSPAAIKQAKQLASKTGLDAEFVCANVYDFVPPKHNAYDLVFTSYGTVCWLPDLDRWAKVIVDNLKPGGRFYMAEFHPLYDLVAGYPYFTEEEPDTEAEGTYTENSGELNTPLACWSHPLSEIFNALIQAGLRIDQFNEYPFSPYNCFEGLEEREPGRFYLKHGAQDTPLLFTLLGHKPA